jgi:ATP-dependent DNA ligase
MSDEPTERKTVLFTVSTEVGQAAVEQVASCDDDGRPVFRDLLFRHRQCVLIAFDLLYLNGKDLRTLPLIDRKSALKKLLQRKRSRILYLDHVDSDGRLLFEQIVKMDLEGIVCKRKDSPYGHRQAFTVLDEGQESEV